MMKSYFLAVLFLIGIFHLNFVSSRRIRRPKFRKSETTFRSCPFGYGGLNCDIECGKVYFDEESKIIGGKEAAPHSSPSTVYLLIKYIDEYGFSVFFTCGGSLIDEETILTAGHCVSKSTVYDKSNNNDQTIARFDEVIAFLGVHNIADVTETDSIKPPVVKIIIKEIIRNQYFNDIDMNNDLALLKLSKRVDLNKYIQIACLPTSNFPIQSGTKATAFGWGTTKYNGESSDVLMKVEITIYNVSKCINVLPDLTKDWKEEICAGDLSGKKDTCNGDSGGPLFVTQTVRDIKTGDLISRNVLAGLTSYGDECAIKNKPAIYTRVSDFIDWINRNI